MADEIINGLIERQVEKLRAETGMKFIKFTDPNGGAVWIAGQWVTRVQSAVRGQHATGARTILSMGAKDQAVAESPEQAVQLLESMHRESQT